MADFFFPQLGPGVVAQYPLRKTRSYRTIKNILPDGRLVLYPDPSARRVQWELSYSNLTFDDVQALQSHYRLCQGPLQSFTFLDPTGNLFSYSEDLASARWLQANQILVEPSVDSALPSSKAFQLTNIGQASADLFQSLAIPANYVYSLSMYAKSAQVCKAELFRRGASAETRKEVSISQSWSRVSFSGSLQDRGTTLEAGLTLPPGQQIEVTGIQLEAQLAPSQYRRTGSRSGVYPNASYGANEMLISVDAPDIYSTTLVVESAE